MTKVFSMFSGIGGFELGLLMSGKDIEFTGYSEIDKYAIQIFEKQFKGVKNYGDATTIDETRLPGFSLLVGGFPCQAFSIAGKRKGFEEARGTLFFDIARILEHKKPKYFILENVRGLLSHDSGRTFQTILKVLADIGYMVQWEVCNSKNYGVPQNRERVYIVGHLRGRSRPEVFPVKSINEKNNRVNQPKELTKDLAQAYRVYDISGISTALGAVGGGVGAKTGLYQVGFVKDKNDIKTREDSTCVDANYYKGIDNHGARTGVMVKEATKKGYSVAEEGDSINLSIPNSKTRRGRVGKGVAQTLDTKMEQHILKDTKIRRLTPMECERLQGFPDGWTDGISDTQRYKSLGNAVTTTVVCEIAKKLLK